MVSAVQSFLMTVKKKYKVAIIDYEFGNAVSVKNALDYLKIKNEIKKKPNKLKSFTHLILPGDGFFPSTVNVLKKEKWDKAILSFFKSSNRKVIGICVGLQVMCNFSSEGQGCKGFGLIKGKCIKLDKKNKKKIKLPHIGFNKVNINNIKYSDYFYFIHSYGIQIDKEFYHKILIEKDNQLGFTNYGINFLSFINTKKIAGFQFHPEKSSNQGLTLLKKTIEFI